MNDEMYNRIIKLLISISYHRYCEDGFYACPKNEDYFGSYDHTPIEQRPCECYGDDAAQLLKDLEASK